MKVDQRKKVSAFQSDFKAEFGIGVRVYKGRKFAEDVPLKNITEPGSKGGDVEFHGKTKVKTIEKMFKEEMGITIQIEDKKGDLADNEATLASLR